MNPRTIRELLRAAPFKPFQVVMSSGERYAVRHPEMAMVLQNNLLIGVEETEEGFPGHFVICALLLIASTEPLEQQNV